MAEPTDAEIDDDLKTLGFDARDAYPEYGHNQVREAYRAGRESAQPLALAACPRCGSLVGDQQVHDAWHKAQDERNTDSAWRSLRD